MARFVNPLFWITVFASWVLRGLLGHCGGGLRAHVPFNINNPRSIRVGKNVTFGAGVIINSLRAGKHIALTIGSNTVLGRMVNINAYKSVLIGENVLISERVYISDATHIHEEPSLPIASQGTRYAGAVEIGDGAWIGCGAVILPGVIIGSNSVVAANSVVTRDVPPGAIAAGVPAVVSPKF